MTNIGIVWLTVIPRLSCHVCTKYRQLFLICSCRYHDHFGKKKQNTSTVIIPAPKVSVFADSDMMSEATSIIRHQENIPTFNAPSPAKNLAWGTSAFTVTSTPASKSTTEHTPVPDIVMSSSFASKSKDAVPSMMPTAHATAPVTPPLTPAVTMPAQPPVLQLMTASASTSSSDNPKYDMSQRVFRYFLKLRLEEENIAVNANTEDVDLSEDFKYAVQSILDRLTRFKARIRLWRLATEVNFEKLTKDTLRSLFWKIFESSNYVARWILLFFFLTDLIILVLKRRPSLEENLILWSTDLVREGISPFARENGGWKYFLFLNSECNVSSESQNEDTTDLYGSFKWKPHMIKTLKRTMKAAILQYKNLRANQRNGYKKMWTAEFTKCLPSFNVVNNKTRFLRAKYVGSKKHKHQKIQKAMSKKFLKYLKLTVQTLLTRKETTTCEEILTFLKETKQKELQMEYPVKNVKRSIRRAMDNFSRTGSTSLKRPGRPPMSETLREKIITLSRNKRYRR